MITEPDIDAYLQKLHRPGDAILQEMEESGHERGFPIIGPAVGRLCMQLASTIQAKRIFEMGSGFGYSTYWFARAVGKGGEVVHTDGDAKLSEEAKTWLERGNLATRVRFEVGDARKILVEEADPFDVIFIDIDKEGYPEAWESARERVVPGGLVLTDNVLWQGKVLEDAKDGATRGVKEYTREAMSDPEFLTTILPVRDGVAVSLRLLGP